MGDHVNLNFSGGSARLVSGRGSITFLNIGEQSGVAAGSLSIWDGQDTGGILLAYIHLNQGETIAAGLGRGQLVFKAGVFVGVIGGSMQGNIAVNLTPSDAEWEALLVLSGVTP